MSAVTAETRPHEAARQMYLRAQQILRDHASHSTPYGVSFQGLTLRVDQQVFSPTSTPSTLLLARHLVVHRGDRVLDVGTGTGALALLAAQRTSSTVLATDVSSDAVECARQNIKEARAAVEARQSDLFETIGGNERFTLIIFNPPFADAEPRAMLERSVFDYRHATLDRFLREAPLYLASEGRIVTVFGGYERELPLAQLARHYRYRTRILAETTIDVHLVVYELTCPPVD
jgi:Methylase of polypeptide chain release factors